MGNKNKEARKKAQKARNDYLREIIDFTLGIGKRSVKLHISRGKADNYLKMYVKDPTKETIKEIYRKETK
jgi:hypothetical protein